MKVIFIVQGEGRGHLTQALSLAKILRDNGDMVSQVFVGKSPTRQIPDFFTKKIGCPVSYFESPNFLPSAKNKKASLMRSILYNVSHLGRYIKSINFMKEQIDESGADLVINFYELITGLTYLLRAPKVRMICIAHQYLMMHPLFSAPRCNPVELLSLKLFTHLTAIGAEKKLALSFRNMPDHENITVVPPLLRNEVRTLDNTTDTAEGRFLLGYLLNSGYSQEVIAWHKNNPQTTLHFFWDKKSAPEEYIPQAGLTFHKLNDETFLRYMAGCSGYATTAGFESVCEALYLGKPVMMIPTHIEQQCNAYDAMYSGAGTISEEFNLDKLKDTVSNYKPDPGFRNWADQAHWKILNALKSYSNSCQCPTSRHWFSLKPISLK